MARRKTETQAMQSDQSISIEQINAHIAQARRLRAEALARMGRAAGRAVRRGIARLRGMARPVRPRAA